MIIRAFRLTDKLGNAALKTLVWLSQAFVRYVYAAGVLFEIGLGAVGKVAAAVLVVLRALFGAVRYALAFIIGMFVVLFGLATGDRTSLARGDGGSGVFAGGRALARRSSGGSIESRRMDDMARRADELSETVILVEDPLKARNRTLSALLVVALIAVVILLIWATSPRVGVAPAGSIPSVGGVAVQPTPVEQITPFATPIPTVTPRPESLRVGGSLVYTVRDGGQDDLWATVIGSSAPIQITNNPADDRDAAWSPDGRYLAFTSNRDGNWELYVQDVRTGEATRLTYSLGYEGAPSWSPDGQWLVYEAYNEDNLDIYITRVDGTQGPIRLTYDPAPDFSPVWAPGGREILYVSRRGGDQDIYMLSLDDPTEAAAVNLTGTPQIDEEHPAWSPDGTRIAYSARIDGLEAVFVKTIANLDAAPDLIDRGRAPAWSPDGNSLIYVVDQGGRSILVAGQVGTVGVPSQAIDLLLPADNPDWTAWRPQNLPAVAIQPAPPLYNEQISFVQEVPPYYRLALLGDVQAPNPYLSDRVNDSFMALREAVLERTGVDYLGELEDAFWPLDRPPEPGQDPLNWHFAGRAIALNRNLIYGFPPPLEVVREDDGIRTFWRIYARTALQDGQMGEPLTRIPWDFAARSSGDVQAYEEGGRLRSGVPAGYYVDLTQLFADFGWERIPADRSWRRNFSGVSFWEAVKNDGLSWPEAMLEIYSVEELDAFLAQPTAPPTSTLGPPTATPSPTWTPTPEPPDQAAPSS